MKRYIKWGIGFFISPILLFIIVCILIYIPPVQSFLVGQTTRYASQTTGMDIRIGRLSLGFPLDLVVYDALVIDYPVRQAVSNRHSGYPYQLPIQIM